MPTAHVDTFTRDHLPPPNEQPEFLFELPALQFPAQLNCATELLDRQVAQHGDRPCLLAPGMAWSYRELQRHADRIAHVLVQDMGVVPGNRVLLRGPNHPMLVACWFAVMKVGAVAVTTMPMLRAKELAAMIAIGQVTHALCDAALVDELRAAQLVAPTLRHIRCWHETGEGALEAAMARHDAPFVNVDTAADDTCLLAFTSGTTGIPKATMHFHRDVMAICACWPPHVLRAEASDVFTGSPPLAFTFGLGGLVLFPMSIGASTVLLDKVSPPQLLDGIRTFGATVVFTAPTSYRAMAAHRDLLRETKLRKCVSAGEALPPATRTLWRDVTGIELIDGIGATELLHIFISADEAHARAGATGTPVPGYRAEVVDEQGQPVPPRTVGRLRVKGPTGCRYLRDERQRTYVQDGWNYTGDAYAVDEDGYFHYQARLDDIIISSGYNIAGPEVENVLLQHPAVAECGVTGVPDEERGQLVAACVVLRPGYDADAAMIKALQDFVKQTVAPYKYPRLVVFVPQLPRTTTGKLQRFRLRELTATAAVPPVTQER
ncbi:MAG: AMP-binding protein [Gemmatimonadetes bacterium]|nr:AMP-binding protein [Gemmatimonadota bacterium]